MTDNEIADDILSILDGLDLPKSPSKADKVMTWENGNWIFKDTGPTVPMLSDQELLRLRSLLEKEFPEDYI